MHKSHHTPTNARLLKGKILKSIMLCMLSLSLTVYCVPLLGQADKKENVSDKGKPRISLAGTQINGDSILLQTTVKVKRDGSWQPVDFESIKFFVPSDSTSIPLGEVITNDRGVASLKVAWKQLTAGEDGLWMFGSVFEGNEIVAKGEAELSVRAAGIAISGEKKDTTFAVTLKLFIPGPDKLPITEAEVGFYVKRHFSNLKIGEGTTDENGEVTIDFPKDLPGDSRGNIVLIGQADDLEEYGSVAAFMEKPWGAPRQEQNQQVKRALWTHAPPLWMVITFAILMSTVWGHYIVIIYKLVKLRNPKIQNP